MGFLESHARSHRMVRVVGALFILPLAFLFASMGSDRQVLVLITPRDTIATLDGEPVPKKSATNYRKKSEPLTYEFPIDDGSYVLRVAINDSDVAIERTLVIDYDTGDKQFVEVIDTDDGIAFKSSTEPAPSSSP